METEIQKLKKISNQMRVHRHTTIKPKIREEFQRNSKESLQVIELSLEDLKKGEKSSKHIRRYIDALGEYCERLEKEIDEVNELLQDEEFTLYLRRLDTTTNALYNEGVEKIERLILSNGKKIEDFVDEINEASQVGGLVLGGLIVTIIVILVLFQRKIYSKNRELQEHEELFQTIATNIENVIIVTKREKCMYVSDNIERVLGIKKEDCFTYGESLEECMTKEMADLFQAVHLEEPLQKDYRKIITLWNPIKKENRSMSMSIYSLNNFGTFRKCENTPLWYVTIITDVTESCIREQKLQSALEEAKQAAKVKEDFLSHMSHEIRNPIYSINGLCGMLEKELEKDPQVKEYVKSIQLSSNYLLALVNNVLDEAKLEHNKMVLANEVFSMKNFIEQFVQTVRLQVMAKEIELKCEIGPLTDMVYGDTLRLHQILSNICSNAIKFTQKHGKIHILIHNIASDEAMTKIQFEICDNGIGMSEEYLNKLFLPFEQDRTSQMQEGTGLGMTITYQLVKLMGGEINVLSQRNVGTKMVVVLPFQKRRNQKYAMDEAKEYKQRMEQKLLKGKHVLVVEDNSINCDIIKNLLETIGMVVDIARNGMEAVQKFVNSPSMHYQVILMDIELPDMNGYMVTQAIRSSKREDANEVPILALTADMDQNGMQKVKEKRLNGYILKPVDVEILYHTITTCICESGQEKEVH